MTDKIITLLVGLLLALGGWSLSRTFELSTIQAVHEDKVQVLREQVLKLEEQIDKMMDSDEDIMEQHKQLFKILEKGDTPTGSYNYYCLNHSKFLKKRLFKCHSKQFYL